MISEPTVNGNDPLYGPIPLLGLKFTAKASKSNKYLLGTENTGIQFTTIIQLIMGHFKKPRTLQSKYLQCQFCITAAATASG